MNQLHFLSKRLRPATLILLFLCVSSYAHAQQIEQSGARSQVTAAAEESVIIDAVVTEVQGAILKLEGGLSVDISRAVVFQITTSGMDRSLIKPGTCIRAFAKFSSDATAPLAAEFVRIRVPNEIILAGVVQALDLDIDEQGEVTGGSITVLNRKILIQGPFMPFGLKRKGLKVGKPLLIVASTNGTELVAGLILPGGTLQLIAP